MSLGLIRFYAAKLQLGWAAGSSWFRGLIGDFAYFSQFS